MKCKSCGSHRIIWKPGNSKAKCIECLELKPIEWFEDTVEWADVIVES